MDKDSGRGSMPILFPIMCCVIFCVSVFFVFAIQQKSLNHEFDRMVSDNLEAYLHGQSRQAKGFVTEAQNTLASIATMISSTELSPDGEWLDVYLWELSESNRQYQIDYLTAEQLRENLGRNPTPSDREIAIKLLGGERIVSEIVYSVRLGGSFFAVAEPVVKQGQVVGALRIRIESSALTSNAQKPGMFQAVHSIVVKKDGTILFAGTKDYKSSGDLFSSIEHGGVSATEVDRIKEALNQNTVSTLRFRGKEREYFMSFGGLGYRDWILVDFVRSPDILIRSQSIMRSVVATGLFLILLTMGIGGGMMSVLMRQRRLLNLEQHRYAVLSQFSDTVLFEYDCESDTVEFTPNAKERFCLQTLTMQGVSKPEMHHELIHPDDRPLLQKMLHQPPGGQSDAIQYDEARLRCCDGEYRWFGCQYKSLSDQWSKNTMVVGKLVDITDQRSREQSLIEQSQKDPLTGTYNKAGEERIEQLLQEDPRGLLFMVDLDDFKEVNDRYGHAAGDRVLADVGAILKQLFRAGDIVARVGGDEFIVFLPKTTDRRLAEKKARKVLDQVHLLSIDGAESHPLSVSIGVAATPPDGCTFDLLYCAADQAMYQIKRGTKSGFAFQQMEN